MHKVGYHVASKTVYVMEFDELIDVHQKYDDGDKGYVAIMKNKYGILDLVLYRLGDYIEYYGKKYKFPDLNKFCLEWRNIQTEKIIESL